MITILHGLAVLFTASTLANGQNPCKALQYNRRTEKCCDGVVQDKPYGTPRCCGSVAYNVENFMCCRGQVTQRPNSDRVGCCGTQGYDKDTEKCCSGVVYWVGSQALDTVKCCGRDIRDREKEICCKGHVSYKPQGKDIGCCGYKPYNKDTHACANDIIVPTDKECIEACYDIYTEVCCRGVITPKYSDYIHCCGEKSYIPHIYNSWEQSYFKCCGDEMGGSISNYSPHTKCCGVSEQYFDSYLNNEMCCGGVVNDRHKQLVNWADEMGNCCGNISYHPKEAQCCADGQLAYQYQSTCCNGKRHFLKHFPLALSVWQPIDFCCGDGVYDPYTSICCDGEVVKLSYDSQKCCGRKGYNPLNAICCSGSVHYMPPEVIGMIQCCGTRPYDAVNHVCCEGNLVRKSSFAIWYTCCEDQAYPYVDWYVCCGNTYHEDYESLGCCLNDAYNNFNQICCNNTVNNIKNDNTSCCGKKAYENETEICCEDTVNPILGPVGQCCGSKSIDLDIEFCCNDIVYSDFPNSPGCCGGKLYDSSIEMCCNNVVNPLKEACCGYRSYNSGLELCCEGNVYENPQHELACCGESYFNKNKEVCCSNDWIIDEPIMTGPLGEQYIPRKRVYESDKFICCLGKVHLKQFKNTKCCGRLDYDADNAICDDIYGVRVKNCSERTSPDPEGSNVCCGNDKWYDPVTEICCTENGNSEKHPKTSESLACCGLATYDTNKDLCCKYGQGASKQYHAVFDVSAQMQCCERDIVFDPVTQICCKGAVLPKTDPDLKCCGSEVYLESLAICCDGYYYERSVWNAGWNLGCCGPYAYSIDNDICCKYPGWRVESKITAHTKCCGAITYEADVEKCCSDKEVARGHFQCCNEKAFDPSSQICCYGKVYNNADHSLACIEGSFLPFETTIDIGTASQEELSRTLFESFFSDTPSGPPVYNANTHGLCGHIPYEWSSETCCIGKDQEVRIFSRPYGNIKCCVQNNGIGLYDPDMEICWA